MCPDSLTESTASRSEYLRLRSIEPQSSLCRLVHVFHVLHIEQLWISLLDLCWLPPIWQNLSLSPLVDGKEWKIHSNRIFDNHFMDSIDAYYVPNQCMAFQFVPGELLKQFWFLPLSALENLPVPCGILLWLCNSLKVVVYINIYIYIRW